MIVTHLNVNSLQYKFMELGEILYDKLSDICFFSETKLDDTFNQFSFDVPDYKAGMTETLQAGGLLRMFDQTCLLDADTNLNLPCPMSR